MDPSFNTLREEHIDLTQLSTPVLKPALILKPEYCDVPVTLS